MTKRRPLVETTDIPSHLAELKYFYSTEPRREGDADCDELAELWGVKQNQARRRMEAIAADGEWEYLLVRDPKRRNLVAVLRKKEREQVGSQRKK